MKKFVITILCSFLSLNCHSKSLSDCFHILNKVQANHLQQVRGVFRDGEGYIRSFELPGNAKAIFIAEIEINDSTLKLKNITIFNDKKSFGRIEAGLSLVGKYLSEIKKEAKEAGFKNLILDGERITGKAPNRLVSRNLTL